MNNLFPKAGFSQNWKSKFFSLDIHEHAAFVDVLAFFWLAFAFFVTPHALLSVNVKILMSFLLENIYFVAYDASPDRF